MKILNIHPTVFISRSDDILVRRIKVELSSPSIKAISFRELRRSVNRGWEDLPFTVAQYRSESPHVITIDLPELRHERVIELRVTDHSGEIDVCTQQIRPARKWKIHVVQLSHHDAGYTDTASRVLDDHCHWLDDAIEYADANKSLSEDARFRIVIEQGWSLLTWLERAQEAQKSRMIELLRSGDFELTAIFGNMITEICGHEELIRTLYPSFELGRKYGIPIVSAEHNDIPGFSSGLARILTDTGIKLFCPGIPRYYDWGGDDLQLQSFWNEMAIFGHQGPGAFWWRAPTGKKILFWCNNSGCGGDSRSGMPGLANRLEELDMENWPYSILRWPVSGGARDNSPYTDGYSKTIEEWNERWVYPKLVSSTNARFYANFVNELPDDLPTIEGELPGQDYPAGAISTTRTTAVNRRTQSELPAAELLTTTAADIGSSFPTRDLQNAWVDMLWYDEHAWGHHFPAGPAMDAALAEKSVRAFRASALAHDLRAKAMATIADAIDGGTDIHDRDTWTLTIFNLSGSTEKFPIRIPLRGIDNCGSTMFDVMPDDSTGKEGYRRGVILNNRWHANLPDEFLYGKFELQNLTSGNNIDFEIETITPDTPVPYAPERAGLGAGGNRYGMFENPVGIARDLIFVDEGIPAYGYETYLLQPAGDGASGDGVESAVDVRREPASREESTRDAKHEDVIENDYFTVRFDPRSGAVTSIRDKTLKNELLDASCPHGFGELVVRDPPAGSLERHEHTAGSRVVESVHRGDIHQYVDISESLHGHPRITKRISLYKDVRAAFVSFRILKDPTPLLDVNIAFPFLIESPHFRYSATLSTLTPIDDYFPGAYSDTVPVQEWVSVSDDTRSIVWSGIDAPVVSLGAFHPGYVSPAHRCRIDSSVAHPPQTRDDYRNGWIYSVIANNNFGTNFAVSQSGSLLARYVFSSQAKSPELIDDIENTRFGRSALLPSDGIFASYKTHIRRLTEDKLSPRGSLIEIDPPELVLLAYKNASDGDGRIVRVWNRSDHDLAASIRFPFLRIDSAELCDPVERMIAGDVSFTDHVMSFSIKCDDVTTVRVRS